MILMILIICLYYRRWNRRPGAELREGIEVQLFHLIEIVDACLGYVVCNQYKYKLNL